MSDPHTLEGQAQRAKRLREQIENLKSGTRSEPAPGQKHSLREQIEERAKQAGEREENSGAAR